MSASISQAWRSIPRVLRGTLIAAVSAVVGWIALVNVLLATGVVERWVTGEHEIADVQLKIGRAWMLRPDTVHVRDFELNVDAYGVRLHIEIPEGEARIAFLALLDRTFYTRSITGRTGTIMVQRKKPEGEVDERRLAQFPPIGSFGPPVRDAEPPEPPPLEKAMRVKLEGVDLQSGPVWVDEVRIDPAHGRLGGNLRVVVGHAFAVWDASLNMHDAEVSIAHEDPLLVGMDLHASVDVEQYNPFELRGRGVLAHVTGAIQGSGRVRDIASGVMYLPRRASKVVLAGGAGPFAVTAGLESGVLQPGTRLTYETDSIRAHARKLVIGSRLQLAMNVESHDGEMVSHASIDLQGVHGGLAGTKQSRDGIVAREIDAFVTFANTDITSNEWPLADARLSIPRLRISDLGMLEEMTDALTSAEGSLELSWKTSRLDDGHFAHDGTLEASDVSMATDETSVRGSTKVTLGARTNAAATETRIGKLQARLDGLAITSPRGSSDATWVRIDRGEIVVRHSSKRIDARLRGRLEDLRTVLAHATFRRTLIEKLPDLEITQPLTFDVGIQTTRSGWTLDLHDLSRPTLNVTGKLRKIGAHLRFAFELRAAKIGVYGIQGGKSKVDVAIPDDWLRTKVRWIDALGSDRSSRQKTG